MAMNRSGPIVDRVRDRLVADGRPATPASVARAVRAEGAVLGDLAVHRMARDLASDLVGLGPLQALVDDPSVTDVLVNGSQELWVDRGRGLESLPPLFPDDDAVRRLAVRLAAAAGRRLDDAQPCTDIRVGEGIRLHAVLPPIVRAPHLSLRIPRRTPFSLAELTDAGMCGEGAVEWLSSLIGARVAFLVTGGTGTGKTTLLGAMLGLVPDSERLVLVEDSAELRPVHPHVVTLEARAPNVEGVGAIDLRDLVRHALRMRPDRLVVGEARGPEVIDLLSALNTGHEGGCGTLHANSVEDVPARIAALAATGGLGRSATDEQVASALDAVVHLRRDRTGLRRVDSIGVVRRLSDGLRIDAAVTWTAEGCVGGPGESRLRERLARA
jgi:pilus assembly protein CpaF